ncbi:hypothetical protein ACOSQ2_020274 [Xanthoceras sorbifolium]
MVKSTSCGTTKKTCLIKGSWSRQEDQKLIAYISRYGIWNWAEMPKAAGLLRGGKSCRLRWMNYLRPGIKHGNFSQEEDETIINLHQQLGNRWSTIASRLPGRTDNEIKNHWHTHLKKKKDSILQGNQAVNYQENPIISEEEDGDDISLLSIIIPPTTFISNSDGSINCNASSIPLTSPQSSSSFDKFSSSSLSLNCDSGGAEIYNNQTIEEISNGSSGCTYEELQNLWDPLPFPMEDLYYNNEFLVSTPQIWGFKENTYTSASYDDDGGNDLLAYLLMEANGETV